MDIKQLSTIRIGEINMVFKVFYQENPSEIPVREDTKSLYMEAESVRQVRKTLADRNINIEFIQPLDKEHLAYEQQSEHYKLEQAK
jgi:DNA-dependent RNA polymerase auxiliary subunit epsilon